MKEEKLVIIGDGNAGATAAETLRKEDEDADITVLTDESEPLYNRIMLKNYMKGTLPKQYTRVHDENWYEKRNIELRLDTEVENIDKDNKEIKTEEDSISYDKVLVATGGSPREFPIEAENIHYMWTMHDAEIIKNDAEDCEKAVVIGGGLLGIDLAVAYAENDAETYYLIRGENWWNRGLSKTGAEIIHNKLEEKGVKVLTETEVSEFNIENNEIDSVETNSEETIDCESVAVAIGQTPNSDIVEVEKNDSNMIKTNEFLETSEENVFAAGNMVEYYSPVFERRTVNGSWDHSEEMGKYSAKNILGQEEAFNYVNTYGVGHFDVQFLSIGDFTGEAIEKKYSEDEYRRLFFDDNRLIGAVMIGFTRGQDKIIDLIQEKEEFDDREKLLEKSFWE